MLITLAYTPNKLASLVLKVGQAFLNEGTKGVKARAVQLLKMWWPVAVYVLSAGALVLSTVWSLFHLSRSASWKLTFWICLTSALVTLLPIVSKLFFGARPRLGIVFEAGVLAVSLILFARLTLHLPLVHRWSLCALLLILLLSWGGHGVEMLHDSIGRRLTREWDESPGSHEMDEGRKKLVQTHLDRMQRYFIGELIIYSALPIGTMLGLSFCWASAVDFANPLAVVSICLNFVFGLAGSILMWFLASSFIRMISPVLRLPNLQHSDLETGAPATLDWACILTDYRKMFFYDAILNTALVLAFGVFEWFLWNKKAFSVDNPKFVVVVLVSSIVLNEVPYLIGQKRVQRLLTSPYRGWEKGLRMKEVEENIPLVLKFEFIAALVGEASAGGIALEMMKQIAEVINKHA
jgi:hypothetical protein